jgi:hypothetical protein
MFNELKRENWTCSSQRLFGSGRLWIALWNGLCQKILNSYAADRRWHVGVSLIYLPVLAKKKDGFLGWCRWLRRMTG